MARVTVEDCIDKVKNRFELVLLAAHRARSLHNGEQPTVSKNNDKAGVVALREIAEETITVNDLQEEIIKSLQIYQEEDLEENIENNENNEDNDEVKEVTEIEIKPEEKNKELHQEMKNDEGSEETSKLVADVNISDENAEKPL